MEAIRCTQPTCRCDCFSPGKAFLRTCDTCKHGWVAHALEKLGSHSVFQLGMQVEIVQPNIVFDIASLILYGAQATPIRLKILLDRLFSVLQHDEVLQVLHGFGWSYEDYARGYILQDSSGRVLDKWVVTTREEEQVILQQFLRFGETKSIAQEIILQDARDSREKQSLQISPKSESEIKKFIERSNVGMQSFMRGYDPRALLNKSSPFPASAANVTARLMAPAVPNFASPTCAKRDIGGMLLPVSPANPLAGSPLTRLQTMQPFDYRREHISPTLSPSASEKCSSSSQSGHRSPQNLSLRALTPNSLANSASSGQMVVSTPIKAELADRKPTPEPVGATVNPEPSMMDGVLNFSLKDQKSLAHTASQSVDQSPIARISPQSLSPRTPPSSLPSSTHYAEQKIKHLRKSSNPMKRPWQPTPGYGGTLISPSGKKRVLCTACNKTFCDKGALKIHYSAVHLKEMHKCTVEGCNMMFSSRRSRNRHSANPNPKLHMPQARRKLTDDSLSGISDDSKQVSPPQNIAPVMSGLMTSSGAISEHSQSANSDDVKEMSKERSSATTTVPSGAVPTGTNESGEMIYYLDPAALAGIPQQLLPITPKLCKVTDEGSSETDANKSSTTTNESSPASAEQKTRSSRKRKCLVPTRCTQMEDTFVLSDDEALMENGPAQKMRRRSSSKDNKMNRKERNAEESHQSVNGNNNGGDEDEDDDDNDDDDDDDDDNGDDDDDDDVVGGLVMSSEEDGNSSSSNVALKNKACDTNESVNQKQDSGDLCPEGSGKCGPNHDDSSSSSSSSSKEPAAPQTEEPGDAAEVCNEQEEAEDEDGINSDSSMNGLDDIPVDKDNPKKCSSCGKLFPNLFAMKTHYQNIHLKLMHTCTVEGCNAAFPSKRSRDRHSSNLNLHRKLLSTTNSEAEMNNRNSLRDEFLPRIYGQQKQFAGSFVQPGQEGAENGVVETNNNNNNNNNNHSSDAVMGDGTPINGRDTETVQESDDDSGVDQQDGDSDDTELYSSHNNGVEMELNGKDVGPEPDPNGTAHCHICNRMYRDNLVLKEHFEKNHPKEMFRCTIRGCDKIFSTRKSRNRHSQNDNLHRHLSPAKVNGTL